jgi:hypothetical protein
MEKKHKVVKDWIKNIDLPLLVFLKLILLITIWGELRQLLILHHSSFFLMSRIMLIVVFL